MGISLGAQGVTEDHPTSARKWPKGRAFSLESHSNQYIGLDLKYSLVYYWPSLVWENQVAGSSSNSNFEGDFLSKNENVFILFQFYFHHLDS